MIAHKRVTGHALGQNYSMIVDGGVARSSRGGVEIMADEKPERLMPACGVDGAMRTVAYMFDIEDGWYIRYDDYAKLKQQVVERDQTIALLKTKAVEREKTAFVAGHMWTRSEGAVALIESEKRKARSAARQRYSETKETP